MNEDISETNIMCIEIWSKLIEDLLNKFCILQIYLLYCKSQSIESL